MIGEAPAARAATLAWKGRTWQVSSGGIAGVCPGNPNNVTVDAAGYLHLKITNGNGVWSAAELFTTDKLGFGTYQWQIDGPIDTFDKNVVLGLFPYGPAAADQGEPSWIWMLLAGVMAHRRLRRRRPVRASGRWAKSG